jgi:hypothetical protein
MNPKFVEGPFHLEFKDIKAYKKDEKELEKEE